MDADKEYSSDKKLIKESVLKLVEWIKEQPHLPEINECQAIIFLKRCNYEIEAAKSIIDDYFTVKTLCPDLFLQRSPSQKSLLEAYDVLLYTVLPQRTSSNERLIFVKMMNPNMDLFDIKTQIKYFDMVCLLMLHQEKTCDGYRLVMDLKGFPISILSKFDPLTMKKLIYYMQEVMPLRWTGIHYFNIVSFMDQLLSFMKPFMKTDFIDLLHLHENVDDLTKSIPRECLPEDYGGSANDSRRLHEQIKEKLLENVEFFEREDRQIVDENKRPGRPKTVNDVFGIESTFRKLQLD